MARLIANVHVRDPRTHQMVELEAGTEPEPELAALVTNPEAWEDGKPPAAEKQADTSTQSAATSTQDNGGDTKQAASKKAAARPARGRKSAAGEGTSS